MPRWYGNSQVIQLHRPGVLPEDADAWQVLSDVRKSSLTGEITGDVTKDKIVNAAAHAAEASHYPSRDGKKK